VNDNDQKLLWEAYQVVNEDLDRQDVLRAVLQLWSKYMQASTYEPMALSTLEAKLTANLEQILDATSKEEWFQAVVMLDDPEQLTDTQIEQEFVDFNWYTNDRAIIARRMEEVGDEAYPDPETIQGWADDDS
jgi:hypothetical protein